VQCWPLEETRTANSSCVWVAEATVEGRTYTARSRYCPANGLARQLIAAGLADRPLVIRYDGLSGSMSYRSFHAAASWTFSEGDRPVRRVQYKAPPEGLFSDRGTEQKSVSSPTANVVEVALSDGCKIIALPLEETRRCDSCGKDFRPTRRAGRFCSPRCRLRAWRDREAAE
jgi:hypothetical protein